MNLVSFSWEEAEEYVILTATEAMGFLGALGVLVLQHTSEYRVG